MIVVVMSEVSPVAAGAASEGGRIILKGQLASPQSVAPMHAATLAQTPISARARHVSVNLAGARAYALEMSRSSAAQFVLAALIAIALSMCLWAFHDALGATGWTDGLQCSLAAHPFEHPGDPYRDHAPCCDDSDLSARRYCVEFSPDREAATGVPTRCVSESTPSSGCLRGEAVAGALPGCYDVTARFTLLRLHCALVE